MPPPYEMDRIFVVLSCEMLGIWSEPLTPRMLLPLKILPATQSDTFVSETVPPVVYPAGIVTVPAFVPIVPEVEPLFAIEPLTDPVAPKAVLPVSRSPAATLAEAVS